MKTATELFSQLHPGHIDDPTADWYPAREVCDFAEHYHSTRLAEAAGEPAPIDKDNPNYVHVKRELWNVLRSHLRGVTRQKAELKDALAAKDARIAELEKRDSLSWTRREEEHLRTENGKLEARIAELEAKLAATKESADRWALKWSEACHDQHAANKRAEELEAVVHEYTSTRMSPTPSAAMQVRFVGFLAKEGWPKRQLVRATDALRFAANEVDAAVKLAGERSSSGAHSEDCDVLQLGPDLGPSRKPCNCRRRGR